MQDVSKKKEQEDSGKTPRGLYRIHSFGYKIAKSESAVGVDPFEKYYEQRKGKMKILKPPYDPYTLARMSEVSDILPQCIHAMKVNIDGFGWELVPFIDPTEAKPQPADAEEEKNKLSNFLNFVNDRQNITELREDIRDDIESTGYGCIEVIRNKKNDISELHRLQAWSVRIVAPDTHFTEYKQKIRDDNGKFIDITRMRKFKRYVQKDLQEHYTYFKEFGDPRVIGSMDGEVNGKGIPANEVIYISIHKPYTPYGLPRWIGQLVSILGSRKAEEVNYLFFDNKTIPPMIITVAGGMLTEEAMEKLEQIFEHDLKGVDNFHKALVIEATPHSTSDIPGEGVAPVRIEVKPLTEYIAKDAMFMEYRKVIKKSVRSSFKLPPLFTGDTDDYTKATAFMSIRAAEEQVFEPERRKWDYMFNRTIMAEMAINHWTYKSLGAKTSDDVDLVKAIGMVKEGIPVGIIQEAVAIMRGVPIGKVDPEMYKTTLAELMAATYGNKPGEEEDIKSQAINDAKGNPSRGNKELDTATIQKIANQVSEILNADVIIK